MSQNKKHWSGFLPEAGTPIKGKGEYIVSIEIRIHRMKDELKRLEQLSSEKEQELLSEVKENWTISDIVKAREKAIEFNS